MTGGRSSEIVRILLVEDSAPDAELEARELKRAGLRLEMRVVEREDDFRRALAEFAPHVILSDFSMPSFSGMDALSIAREVAPDVPFIFVSGTLGEEYAIRALRNGATDYVLKTNLVRLPAAIERALHEVVERAARRQAEGMFRDVVEFAPDPMVVVNAAGEIVLANAEVERLFGHARSEILGRPVDVLVPAARRAGHGAHRLAYMREPRRRPMGAQIALAGGHRDGREIPVEVSLAPIGKGAATMVVATIRDLTERRAQEARIARLSRIRELTSSLNSALVRLRERDAMMSEICRVAVQTGGFRAARIGLLDPDSGDLAWAYTHGAPGVDPREAPVSARDDESGRGIGGRALRTGRPAVWNDLARDAGVRARERFLQNGVHSLGGFPLGIEGKVAGLLSLHAAESGFFDDDEVKLLSELAANISFALELAAKQERLSYLALYDMLTGLPNRALFVERLSRALEATAPGMLALTVFDLERFRAINDAFGRAAGDRLLQAVAKRLQERVGNLERLAYLGGNSFALSFPTVGAAEEAGRRLEKAVVDFFREPFQVDGREIALVARGGIAVFPDDGKDADTLLRNAEAALKRAKDTGERHLFYAPQINARVSEQLDLEHRLRRAVDHGELFLHFQPKVDLQTRRILGLEALMRWQDAGGALVAPGKFIPVLEQTGLILEAGRQAISVAHRAYRAWQAQGLQPPRIAVNISALQLRRREFVDEVRSALEQAGDDSGGIDLEITESLLMTEVEDSIRKLKELREMGMCIALDDFGTGYSSLAYLARLPVDAVKIDRVFVRGMTENAADTSLVSTVITLAQGLRLKVVAEGVETEEQANLLRLLRCDEAQGYLFARPMPADQVAALLET